VGTSRDSTGDESRRVSISSNKDYKSINTIRIRLWKDMIKNAMQFSKIIHENVEILSSVAILRRKH
jgi:hypothetical protein